jgi:hypothetical protein
MRTFSVKNYSRFQHYKDRSPPWIKLYNELLDDYEFGLLPDATKMHLIAIWLLASRSENKIPFDPKWVGRRINANDPVDLATLVERGFILLDQQLQQPEQVASIAIAECLSREEGEGQVEDIDGGGEEARPASKSMISEEAYEVCSEVLKTMGLDANDPLSVGSPYTVQAWLNGGWPRDAILTGVRRAMLSRGSDPPGTLRYFEKAIARQHAELTRALPKVELVACETTKVFSHDRPSGNIIQAADRLLDKIRSFDAGPDEDQPLRDGEGSSPPRLLSQG